MGLIRQIYDDIKEMPSTLKCITKYIYNDITCKHELEFVRNLYGDPVHYIYGWNRSEWRCKKCGNYKLMPNLHYEKVKEK